MRSLIIGGTRNLGPGIVQALLEEGHRVCVLNRGQTQDDLPREVERLRADRTDAQQLQRALAARDFDLVVDTTLYMGAEAAAIVELLSGRTGRYIFLSTGQVYLVRIGPERPFRENDYDGPLMPEPPRSDEYAHSNWLYGYDKRMAEDIFARSWAEKQFPYTSLRLPMVNSERDHYNRIYGYFLRLKDGGPIIIPEGPGLPVRHVYGQDVIHAIMRLAVSDAGRGKAYNIGQDETWSLRDFLEALSELVQGHLEVAERPRAELERLGLLPHCSPFSGAWMSSLENTRSKSELGIQYTPARLYLQRLVNHFQGNPSRAIEGYAQRSKEMELLRSLRAGQGFRSASS